MRLCTYSKRIQKTGTLTQDLRLEMLASIQMQSHLQLGKQFIYEIPTTDLADWKFSKIPILQELEHTVAVHNNFFLPLLSIVRDSRVLLTEFLWSKQIILQLLYLSPELSKVQI
jgi:hypothetical protein